MEINKTQILLALQRALIGEIYSNIRVIAYKYNFEKKHFILRYYLDRDPTEDDLENIGNVIAEFISFFLHSDFENVQEECVYSDKPLSQIDIMDGVVFCRKE